MIRRREFIAGLGGAAVWPVAVRAQQVEKVRRVGVLMPFRHDDPDALADMAALRRGLADLGWIDGRTIDVVVQWAGGDPIKASAKELVGAKPDVLLSRSTLATVALQRESGGGIPIVFVVAELVEHGFVESLARPGINITGFAPFEGLEGSVGSKMLQLLKKIDPRIARVVVIYNPQTASFARPYLRQKMEAVAASLGVETVVRPVQSDYDIEAAMTASAQQPGSGLVTIPDTFTFERRDLIIALARRMRLPAVYGSPYFTRSGGLAAYTVNARDLMHRAAAYVDRILRGTRPAVLPVQQPPDQFGFGSEFSLYARRFLKDERPANLPVFQPTRFQFVFNLKTAKALGLTVPALVLALALADEVIE